MKESTEQQIGTNETGSHGMSIPPLDQKARQALAKVYALLLRIALEGEARDRKSKEDGLLNGITQSTTDQKNTTRSEM